MGQEQPGDPIKRESSPIVMPLHSLVMALLTAAGSAVTCTRRLSLAEATTHSMIVPTCSEKPPAFAAPASSFAKKAVVPCSEVGNEWTDMRQIFVIE